MRIGLDLQATLGRPTGLGAYAAGLAAALPAAASRHEWLMLQTGRGSRWPAAAQVVREQILLPMAARRGRLDVLHCPAFGLPRHIPGRATIRIVTVHDLSVLERPSLLPSGMSRWYWRRYLPRICAGADWIVTPSDFTAGRVCDRLRFPASRLRVIPYPPRANFAPAPSAALQTLRQSRQLPERFCLAVGALERRKDWAGLLAAFAMLRAEVPHHLLIAGPVHGDRALLRTVISQYGLGSRVRWLGYVPLADLVALYTAAELFIFPETYAGYGLPVLEAMACGAPVLTYANTALEETGANAAAYLQPPYRPERLAEIWLELLRSPLKLLDMSRRGRRRAAALSWKQTADALIELYESAFYNAQCQPDAAGHRVHAAGEVIAGGEAAKFRRAARRLGREVGRGGLVLSTEISATTEQSAGATGLDAVAAAPHGGARRAAA